MGKKSRKAGKAERRQAAAAPAKRTVEFRVKNEMPDYDPDEIYSYAHTIAIDDDDMEAMGEYVRESVFWTIGTDGLESAKKALRRWPEMRDCWARMRPRFRRRLCSNPYCKKQAKLYEPRYLVCSACAELSRNCYYCSEACQREDWRDHKNGCPAGTDWWWDPVRREIALSKIRALAANYNPEDLEAAKREVMRGEFAGVDTF